MYVDRDRRGERGRNIGRDRRGKKGRAGERRAGSVSLRCGHDARSSRPASNVTYAMEFLYGSVGWPIAGTGTGYVTAIYARIPRGSNRYGTRTDLHTPQLCDNRAGTKRGGERGVHSGGSAKCQ